jgi:hypothetical protein
MTLSRGCIFCFLIGWEKPSQDTLNLVSGNRYPILAWKLYWLRKTIHAEIVAEDLE